MNGLTLIILSPEGERARVECDSVTVFARDDARGEGGGSVGIRRGHIPAVIALENNSRVTAKSAGSIVSEHIVSGGFARVKDNTVTVISADTSLEKK